MGVLYDFYCHKVMPNPTSLNFLSYGLSRVATANIASTAQLPERTSPLMPVDQPTVSQLDQLVGALNLKDRALLALQPLLSNDRDLLIAGNYRDQQDALLKIFENPSPALQALLSPSVLEKTQTLLKEIAQNQELLDAGRNALKSA